MTETLLDAALRYAATGRPVFPCRTGAKLPATRHGFQDASTDPEIIRAWWARTPSANVAIATGAPAVDVLDVDLRPAGSGYPALNRIRRAGLLAGARAYVRTPSGGAHLYFDGTGQPGGSLPQLHLDCKARGGYVLAPPSAVNGRSYCLLVERPGGGVLDWPAVRRLLQPPVAQTRTAPPAAGAGLGHLARWLSQQEEGNRNRSLFWAACRAAEAGHRDLDALARVSVAAGLPEAAVRLTIRSALDRTAVPR